MGAAHRGHAQRHGRGSDRAGEGLEGVARVLVPDLTWREGTFQGGLAIEIGADGRIARVAPAAEIDGPGAKIQGPAAEIGAADSERGHPRVERLPGRALLPGFVNAHSHAFQRLLRGRAQWREARAPADFWSWRESMLAVSLALSPEDVEVVSRFAFLEMLHAGITAVGEFHYLRNDPAGHAYADPHEIADRVIGAAREVGLRIALLEVAYGAGGIGAPLQPTHRRFATPELEGFLSGADDLREGWRDELGVTVGIASHSVRAVSRSWLAPIADWARQRSAALHAHVSEQVAEVEACMEAYGRRPVELLADEGVLGPGFTAVHATHADPREVRLLAAAGAAVCACPTTERDLGDGILPAAGMAAAGIAIALGTDSQVVIDPLEEMRALEGHERLRDRRRVVLGMPRDGRLETAPALLAAATEAGADALGITAGRVEPGAWADLVGVDLDHPSIAGWSEATLASMLALSAPAAVVADAWVAGERRIDARHHALDEEARRAFAEVAARMGADAA
jgi:formimidoylglutamate deiminase